MYKKTKFRNFELDNIGKKKCVCRNVKILIYILSYKVRFLPVSDLNLEIQLNPLTLI